MKGYGFLSFAKNVGKNVSNEFGEKRLGSAEKYTTDAIKTASKRATQNTADPTGDLIGNRIVDEITGVSKSSKQLQSNELYLKTGENETDIPRERYISPEKVN